MEEEKKIQSESAKEKTSKTKKTKKAVDNSNETNNKVDETIQEENTTTQKPVEEKKKQTKKSSTTKTKTTSTTSNKPKTKSKIKTEENVEKKEIPKKQSIEEETVVKVKPAEEIKTTVEERIEADKKEETTETSKSNEENKTETEEVKKIDSTEKMEEKPVAEKYILVKEKSQKEKKHIKTLISISILVIAIMIFSVIFALLNINSTKILDGVSILKIDVSGLSIEEARQRVNDAIQTKFTNENDNVILKHGETEVSVNANTFNSKFDIETAVAEAYNIGRKGNIITDNYSALYTKIFKKDITPELQLDEELLKIALQILIQRCQIE